MVSIHEMSTKIGRWLARKSNQVEKESFIIYGTELLLSESSKILSILLISYLLGITGAVVMVLLAALPLRAITGGRHCTSSLRCLIVSIINFQLLGMLATLFAENIPILYIVLLLIISSVILIAVLYFKGPGESINYPEITQEIKEKVENNALKFNSFLLITAIISNIFVSNHFFISRTYAGLAIGILWQSFMITSLGHRFITWLDKGLCYINIK